MKWGKFISKLDEVRTVVRANKDAKADIRKDDPLIDQLISLVDEVLGAVPAVELPVDDGLAACVGDAPPIPLQPTMVVDRGEGEGRMLVMPRDTPHVVRRPVLEEVLDEKELGK